MNRQRVTIPSNLEQKICGTPITYSPISTRACAQWWTLQSEPFRKGIVGSVQGALSYGLTVSWELMPERAKTAVFDAYAVHLAEVEALEERA